LAGIFNAGLTHAQNDASQSASSPPSSSSSLPGNETLLPEVTVQATGETPVTENSGSYTTPQMSTATRLPLSIRETPQSVTVITRQRIEDQNMVTISDAMQNMPGVSVSTSSGTEHDHFYARGFRVDNISFDGLPVSLELYGPDFLLADMMMYDRIEVVRGAAGLMEGAGNPSASVNLVRKRPTRDFRFNLSGHAGS
jgi:outer membrane receptor for ferric coprogen and ferric-rhodotorulic acid